MIKWFLAIAMLVIVPAAAHAEDIKKGKKVFRKCRSCHAVGPEAKNRVGPLLNGIVGRTAASVEGYKYSAALKAAGITWTKEELDAFLTKPSKKVKGTKMIFAGLKKEKDRNNLIAYLSTFAADGSEAAAAPAADAAPAAAE